MPTAPASETVTGTSRSLLVGGAQVSPASPLRKVQRRAWVPWVWVAILMLVTAVLPAEDLINNMQLGPREGNAIKDFSPWLIGGAILIVFGLSIPWAVWNAYQNRHDAVVIVFAGIMLAAITFTLFFGDAAANGVFSHNAAEQNSWSTTAWFVYGENQASATHYPSQTVSYEVVRGWALAGALLFFRFIDWGFSSLLIPLIGMGGVLWAVRHSQSERSLRPILVHGFMLLLLVPVMVLPLVTLEAPQANNPIYQMINSQVNDNDGAPADEPRVSPFVAGTFNVLTDLIERLGSKIAFGTKEPHSIIFQASNDAKLEDGDFDSYMTFAGTCMTAIKSVTAVDKNQFPNDTWQTFFQQLVGTDPQQKGGTLGEFNSAQTHRKHALSPFADAMFYSVSPYEWVYFPFGGTDDYQRFHLMYGVKSFPGQYTYHPNPQIGSGETVQKRWGKNGLFGGMAIDGATFIPDEKRLDLQSQLGLQPMVFSYDDMVDPPIDFQNRPIYVPYCSLATLDRSGPTYSSLSEPAMLPPTFREDKAIEYNWSKYRPADWGDTVRHRIAQRYLGTGSIEFCKTVSPDRQSTHMWGCLIANRFASDATPQEFAKKQVQDAFNTIYRPQFDTEVSDAATAAGLFVHLRDPTSTGYARANFENTIWDMRKERHFVDVFMMAPGVQSQVGMFGDRRGNDETGVAKDSTFMKILFSIGGYCAPTIAGIFAWIAQLLAKLALMVYPHALGLMTFFLIIMAVPYLVRSLWPGQYFLPLEWAKAVAVVCLIPFYAQFGLALIEMGNSMGTLSMFIRTSAGGDFGESLCNLFGAGIIISSMSFAAATVAIGFGTLSGMLATINANAFKLAGAGAAAMIAVTGIAAVAGAKVLGAGLAAKMLGGTASKATDVVSKGTPPTLPPPGGGGGPPGGGGPGPTSSGPGGGALPTSRYGVPQASTLNATDSRMVTAQKVYDKASDEHAKSLRSNLADSVGGVGRGLIDAGIAATSGVAGSLDIGSGNSGAAIMSGAAVGGSVVGNLAGSGRSAGAAVASMGDLKEHYRNRRNKKGELLDSVPPNPDAAAKFTALGDSLEQRGQSAWQANDRMAAVDSYAEAGKALRDGAHLENSPQKGGELALRAAQDFHMSGNNEDADRQLEMVRTKASQMPTSTPSEQADVSLLHGKASVLGGTMEVGRGRAARAALHREEAVQHFKSADASFKNDAEAQFRQAQNGDGPSWAAYATSMVGRVQAQHLAEAADPVGDFGAQGSIEAFERTELGELEGLARKGDRSASVVYGAMLSGTGNADAARRFLRYGGVDLTIEEVEKLGKDVSAGRSSRVTAFLGNP